MQKFKGKIGKYKRMNKRQRSLAYLGFQKYIRGLERQNRQYAKENGYSDERNILDKLKVKKGGKFRQEVWYKESFAVAPYWN